MRALNIRNRELLFVHLHKVVEETAEIIARALVNGSVAKELAYPPNAGLTDKEQAALRQIKGAELESGIRKVLAHVAATPLYQLFCLVDGIADPDGNGWTGVSLTDKEADDVEGLFLHTEFLDRYWLWRRTRPEKGWALDTHTHTREERP
jgi:hypothetical protein